MRIGLTMFATDRSITVAELAVAAEERGFAGLYLPEHTHIPVARVTPWPMDPSAELPASYARTVDPYVALGHAAALTSRIRLGTGITLPAQHDPIALAKAVATLDLVSGGRVDLGVGVGWNAEELADHGVEMAQRRHVVADRVRLMQALWRDEVASYDGAHARLSPSWAWPKPVQPGGVPVLLGGSATRWVLRSVVEWADGWLPIGGGGLSGVLPELRARWADAGRPPELLRVVPFGVHPTAGKLDHYADLGVQEVVLDVASAPRDEVLRVLDEHAAHVVSHGG